jgi:hypothetical protein
MKKNTDNQRLTYESDGKMGNTKKDKLKNKRDFFNTTQSSE